MLRTAVIAGLIGTASAFAPGSSVLPMRGARAMRASTSVRMQQQGVPLIKSTRLTPELFNKLDKDRNGTIDLEELKEVCAGC